MLEARELDTPLREKLDRPLLREPEGSRRSEFRVHVLKRARVVLSTMTAIDCEIRDITTGGARIEFAGPVALPETFHLMTVSTRQIVPVARVWQRGLAAGVRFSGAVEKADARKLFSYAI
jgi:hypothetical protein